MFTPNPRALAIFIQSRRKTLKLTQNQVALKTGLKHKTISLFENNPEHAEVSTLFKILSALEMDLSISPKEADPDAHWDEDW